MKTIESDEAGNAEIVIIDDDEHSLTLLTHLLSRAGYAVRSVSSGVLALRSIQAKAPALILLGIQMSGMDGYEVCRRLKADARTCAIPIIFISVLDAAHDTAKGFQMGGVDCIAKPFEDVDVLARVKTHLALRRAQVKLECRAVELETANRQLYAEVNERRRAEQTLLLQQARLEELVAERTAEFQQDINKRKCAEPRQQLLMRILDILNQAINPLEVIREVLEEIKAFTGFEAIGLRLREDEDFPYYDTLGFPPEFVEAERYLCTRGHKQELPRDSQGNPYVECMCRNVLYGRTTPTLPFFTEGGSFWTNSTTALLGSTTEADRQARMRNRCHGEGYESVALIPLRSQGQILGLLQLNDRRIDMLTLDLVQFFEHVGLSIGFSLARQHSQRALRESEIRYRTLFEEAAISLWEEDLSGVKRYIETLRAAGIDDVCTYFAGHPEAVLECAVRVKVLEVNKATLTLYQARSRDELFRNFPSIFCDKSVPGLRKGFCAVAEGRTWCRHEALNRCLNGDFCHLIVHWVTMSGYETTYKRVLVSAIDWTERKQAEEALARSRAEFEAIFNSHTDAVIFANPQRQIMLINPAFTRMFGYTLEDVQGRTTAFLYSSQAEYEEQGRQRDHAEPERDQSPFEVSYRRKDGTIFPAESFEVQVRDSQGQLLGFLDINRDVTERKQVEHERRLNEVRLAALLRLYQMTTTPIAQIADFALEQGIQLTDSAVGFLIFLNEDETIGTVHAWSKTAMAACAVVDKPLQFVIANTGLWGEVVRQRQPVLINNFAAPHPAKKGFPAGHVPIFRYLSIPAFDNNRIVAVAAVANKEAAYNKADVRQLQLFMQGMWGILQRKRAEESLQHVNVYNRSLIEAGLDPLVTIGADGKITDVNTATELATGSTRQDIIGTDFSNYFTEPEHARAGYQQVFRDGLVRDYPLELRHRDGRITSVLYNASVYRDGTGQIVGVFAAARDITERKRAEEAMRQAKEAAEAVSLAKTQFLANVSHELRTPLNTILGYAQLFRQYQNLTETQRQGVDIMLRNGEHLLAMINDLLDLSAIEADQITLTNQPFVLPGMVHDIVASLRGQAEAKGLILYCELSPDLPVVVSGDETRLRQILLNLLSNAIKFTEKGRVILRVTTTGEGREAEGEGEFPFALRLSPCVPGPAPLALCLIHFEVADTGIGIPADQLEVIFTSFYQVLADRSKPKGTGLGLPISRRLARLMQSEIHVQSVAGQGSIFWFDLTLTAMNADQTAAPVAAATAPDAARLSQPEHITPPPSEELAALYELARIGNVLGLRKRLVRLDAADPRWHTFVSKLMALARDIKLQEIRAYLRQWLEESR